ncbi:MAG: bifunctional 4-hydroxy-2-oxoglutarate aldolase/2-dehydro-3-deoxy-phosphogluconate aldolase [Stackebrandtia sp.]
MFDEFFGSHLRSVPVIGIFRGLDERTTVQTCRRAWEAGVSLVEVPVQSAAALVSLRAAVTEAGRDPSGERIVGAGTVTTIERLDGALAAGARFIVSPGLHPEVTAACVYRGVPILPGVATATDIANAVQYGLSWVKAFPAAQLSPGWIEAQHGPFPDVRFVATGGVSADNARAFLDAGSAAIAVTSDFADQERIAALRAALSGRSATRATM